MRQLTSSFKLLIKSFLFIFFFSRCSESSVGTSSFEREEMLSKFINNEIKISADDYNLVLINASDCGACNVKRIAEVQNHQLYNKHKKKYFVFSQNKEELVGAIKDSNVQIVYTDIEMLEKYGLRFFSPYIFTFTNKKLIDFAKIKHN